ncbi:peptidoglycan D,D-transpeptidase FtsI family protein [Propionicicella superfundia]|uniref:peptidoglycan D,D-transpeptidase FtsI family protein n=1 Tax=Propionicicella superfundia TaxID=348582 RepID=UPI00041A43F1|nr:penicillin-binding protein 2 [Propionicicella superfundia]
MNNPIRRTAIISLLMMALLLGNATYSVLFRQAGLYNNPDNRRVRVAEFGQNRGAILVGNTAIAASEPADQSSFKYLRTYSDGDLYAPVTGFYSYLYGRSGLEQSYNSVLSGSDDSLFLQKLLGLATGQASEGASIQTTLDAAAQQAAAEALGTNTGAIVAMNWKTGEILAMVTSPSYDPNTLSTHDTKASESTWKALNADTTRPMANRTVREVYPPGSTFKLVTAAAALENGYTAESLLDAPDKLTLPTTNTVLGNTMDCGGSKITIDQALRVSCNTAFANLGRALGDDKIRAQAEKFGFDSAQLSDLNGVASRFPSDPDVPQTMMSAIGQYDVAATPLQMAMVGAAIANDGVLMKPQIVKSVRTADLQVIRSYSPERQSVAMSSANAKLLKSWMVSVVEDGTGSPAQVSGVTVGGKSGTAESDGQRKPYAWFVGIAENPDVVVTAFVESRASSLNESSSSRLAGPMVAKVIESLT